MSDQTQPMVIATIIDERLLELGYEVEVCEIREDGPATFAATHVDSAPLIAASSKLLEAGKEFVDDLNAVRFDSFADDWPDLVVTFKKMVDAIAMAEGRLPINKTGS